MKPCHLVLGLGAVIMLTTLAASSQESGARVPDTAASRAAAGVIARAERAVAGYVGACAARDAEKLNRLMTRDARIEYTLDDPGAFLSMDSNSLIAACAASPRVSPAGSTVANFWIFPTNDPRTVFVQYDWLRREAETGLQRQLALVEMRGDQIYRMLNFAAIPRSLVASTLRTAAALNDGHRGCGSTQEDRRVSGVAAPAAEQKLNE